MDFIYTLLILPNLLDFRFLLRIGILLTTEEVTTGIKNSQRLQPDLFDALVFT